MAAPFPCYDCSQGFHDENHRRRHRIQNHRSNFTSSGFCQLCGDPSENLFEFRDHFANFHSVHFSRLLNAVAVRQGIAAEEIDCEIWIVAHGFKPFDEESEVERILNLNELTLDEKGVPRLEENNREIVTKNEVEENGLQLGNNDPSRPSLDPSNTSLPVEPYYDETDTKPLFFLPFENDNFFNDPHLPSDQFAMQLGARVKEENLIDSYTVPDTGPIPSLASMLAGGPPTITHNYKSKRRKYTHYSKETLDKALLEISKPGGLTQSEASKKYGITQSTISNWKRRSNMNDADGVLNTESADKSATVLRSGSATAPSPSQLSNADGGTSEKNILNEGQPSTSAIDSSDTELTLSTEKKAKKPKRGKVKQYSKEYLEKALLAISKSHIPITQASRKYKIAARTLRDNLKYRKMKLKQEKVEKDEEAKPLVSFEEEEEEEADGSNEEDVI